MKVGFLFNPVNSEIELKSLDLMLSDFYMLNHLADLVSIFMTNKNKDQHKLQSTKTALHHSFNRI